MPTLVKAVRQERVARTRRRLHDAVARLAVDTPLASLDVVGVCREAGVSRDTFYRYFDSVPDVYADLLADRLDDALMAWVARVAPVPGDAALSVGLKVLVDHLAESAPLYRAALNPGLDARVREVLALYLKTALIEFIGAGWTAELPTIVGVPEDTRAELLAAFAAAGTVGVIEANLRAAEFDRQVVIDSILVALPAWWHSPNETVNRREKEK